MSNKKWRPDEWKTLEASSHPLHCLAPDACVGASFEAGASAMLDALRKHEIDLASKPNNSGFYHIPSDPPETKTEMRNNRK